MKWSIRKKFLSYVMMAVLAVSSLGLTACNPDAIVVEKYSETVSQGLYAAGDALIHGRIDLAELYILNLEKIIPIPKGRISITPVIYNGIHYVVLNDREKNSKVIIVGDADFTNLLKLKVIVQAQQVAADKFQQQAQDQVKKDADALNAVVIQNAELKAGDVAKDKEIAEYHASLEYRVKAWIHGFWLFTLFGVPSALIIGGVLCFFFPPMLPFFGEVFGSLFGIVSRVLGAVFGGLLSWFTWVTTPKT